MSNQPESGSPTSPTPHREYVLRLQADRRRHDPEGHVRLRIALKRLLRSMGLTCLSVLPVEVTEKAKPAD
jgi:hypothetical protein